ncbi:MAG: hypothetical protein J5I90_22135 [Caldilineales bacterium]|nr:hypothetical protein [Caldilineales bacterium]
MHCGIGADSGYDRSASGGSNSCEFLLQRYESRINQNPITGGRVSVDKHEEHAQAQELTLPAAHYLENICGQGVRSEVEGLPVAIESLKLFG